MTRPSVHRRGWRDESGYARLTLAVPGAGVSFMGSKGLYEQL